MKDEQRILLIQEAMRKHGLDAIVCTLPSNVLLFSGYWPVVGTSVAIALSDGRITLVVPEDEQDLAARSWAAEVVTFLPDSLEHMTTAAAAIRGPLRKVAAGLGNGIRRLGCDGFEATEPISYAAMHRYGEALPALLQHAFPSSDLISADDLLMQLRSIKTPLEIDCIRIACQIAERAFRDGARQLRVGLSELEAAAIFRLPLSTALVDFSTVERADGFVSCMSGANSALASGAYARSRTRRLEAGDLVLVHCNSYADGYWTDITRTYSLGAVDHRQQTIYAAVFAARAAAMEAIRNGTEAADVDRAARDVLVARGFGAAFKHGTGHGVGHSAINPNALPRLHPRSTDSLNPGMVFNVEPAVYLDGYGGIRHCDMMAMTDKGRELLTPFQCSADELVIAT
jgi:Xaa-Pro aminopeptidase